MGNKKRPATFKKPNEFRRALGRGVKVTYDKRKHTGQVIANKPQRLIERVGADVLAAFARVFVLAERIEGVQFALFSTIREGDPNSIAIDNMRTTLVYILLGYLREAVEPLQALALLGIDARLKSERAAESWAELIRMSERYRGERVRTLRDEFIFHAGKAKHYRAGVDRLPKMPLVLVEFSDALGRQEQRFPFARQLLIRGISEPSHNPKAARDDAKAFFEDLQRDHVRYSYHLQIVFADVLRTAGYDFQDLEGK